MYRTAGARNRLPERPACPRRNPRLPLCPLPQSLSAISRPLFSPGFTRIFSHVFFSQTIGLIDAHALIYFYILHKNYPFKVFTVIIHKKFRRGKQIERRSHLVLTNWLNQLRFRENPGFFSELLGGFSLFFF